MQSDLPFAGIKRIIIVLRRHHTANRECCNPGRICLLQPDQALLLCLLQPQSEIGATLLHCRRDIGDGGGVITQQNVAKRRKRSGAVGPIQHGSQGDC